MDHMAQIAEIEGIQWDGLVDVREKKTGGERERGREELNGLPLAWSRLVMTRSVTVQT